MITSPVIFYHKIDRPPSDAKIRGAFTSPKRFENQLVYLKTLGVNFLTASELIGHYRQDGAFPRRSIAVTFDDGWKDNYTGAFPILKKLGIRATIFIVPACVGRTTDDVTAEGEAPREHLSEENIREMCEFGIEFGSHSMDHRLFNQISETEIEYQAVESKNYIENLLQKDCGVFAYPAGFFTDAAKTILKNAGYSSAFSTVYGPTDQVDLFALNRAEILRRDRFPFRFERKIRSLISDAR